MKRLPVVRRSERTYGPGAGALARLPLGAVVVYDSFTRANGAIGSTEAVGPSGEAVTAQLYEALSNTAVVASNQAVSAGANVAIVRVAANSFSQDVTCTVVAGAGNGTGPIVRFGSLVHYVRLVLLNTGAWALIRRVSNLETEMAAGTAAGATAVLRLRVAGTNYRAYVDGLLVAEVIYSNGDINENDSVGWRVDGTSSGIDNFTVRAVV